MHLNYAIKFRILEETISSRILYLLLIFFNYALYAQKIEEKGIEKGYFTEPYGELKDMNKGVFKQYDYVWKQDNNLFVVKKKRTIDNEFETLECLLVDSTGKRIGPHIFNDLGDFSEGLAEYTFGRINFCSSCLDNGRYWFVVLPNRSHGFINKQGKIVIKAKYFYVSSFNNGLCLVAVWENHSYFINKKGEQQFGKVFKDGEPFRGNVAAVTYRNGAKNFINTKGENLIPKYYQYIQPFSREYWGMIRAYQPKGGKIGFWTSNCEELLQPQFEDFNYGYLRKKILVKKDNKYGFLDFFSGQTVPS